MSEEQPKSVKEDRSLIVRAVWFLFIGWWATGVWLSIAWVLNLLIITIPLGIKMINMVPFVLSLKSPEREVAGELGEETLQAKEQRNLFVRAIWFVFIGWWASGIWMVIAYVFTITIVGIPVAIWMYGKLPFIVSLYNY